MTDDEKKIDAKGKVGYKHPPEEGQIKKGERRNPKGRPRKTLSPTDSFMKVAMKPVRLPDGTEMTTDEVIIQNVAIRAASGHDRFAVREWFELRRQHLRVEPSAESRKVDGPTDMELLGSFMQDVLQGSPEFNQDSDPIRNMEPVQNETPSDSKDEESDD